MSAQPAPIVAEPPPPTWPMLRAMVGVGLLCGILIATTFLATRPTIERNQAEALQRAVFDVIPKARSSETYLWLEEGRFEAVGEDARREGPRVHAGYDAEGRLVGVAIEASGMGYQDVIRVLYGYAPDAAAVVGMRVLESRETPGLGDRIETDAAFVANFEALDVSLEPAADGAMRIAHPIEAVKSGSKQNPWEIDGITGATISAQAIANILRRSSSDWIPRIQQRLDDFQRGES